MKLLKPVLVVVVLWLLIKLGIPYIGSIIHPGTWPVVPTSVMKMYVLFLALGVILIYTFSEEGYRDTVGPIADLYTNPAKGKLRLVTIIVVGLLGAYITFQYVKPSFDPPPPLRSIHPAPPNSVKMWNKTYNLQTLKNPLREDKANLAKNIEAGGVVYYQNCYYCHGDKMMGKGPFFQGYDPVPLNFVDIGTIAQLTESFVFWRIGTGGPGLPSEATPWKSAMPIWHEFISEQEVWQVILFLYDYTGHSPRVTTEHH